MRIGLTGATGRMGAAVAATIIETDGFALATALVRDRREGLGDVFADAELSADLAVVVAGCDVVVDFSRPELVAELAPACATAMRPIVTGTTGLDSTAVDALEAAAGKIAVFVAPNMSIGVNLLEYLVENASKHVPDAWTVEVHETHHADKVDAPSGTALRLGATVEQVRGRDTAGYRVEREGDIVGIHQVVFAGPGERLTLGHEALDRMIFARGALRAAAWVRDKTPGSYGMGDVLGLKSS